MNNDLISREALKEAFYNRKRTPDDMKYLRVPAELVYEFISNAPAVEYPFYQEAYQTGYEEGYSQGYIDGSTGADWRGEK